MKNTIGTRSKEGRASINKSLIKNRSLIRDRGIFNNREFLHTTDWTDSFQNSRIKPGFLDQFFRHQSIDILVQHEWGNALGHYKSLLKRRNKSNNVNEFYQKIFDKIIDLYEHEDHLSEKVNRKCLSIALRIGAMLSEDSILPSRIAKSEEGSIVFDIDKDGSFYSLEVFNDEEIVFLQDVNGEVNASSIDANQISQMIAALPK